MKTVIEMAREADIEWDLIDKDEGQIWYITKAGLERFAELVRADERESICKFMELVLTCLESPAHRSCKTTQRHCLRLWLTPSEQGATHEIRQRHCPRACG